MSGFQGLNGKQIRNGVIEDSHVKGKFSESVLNINWSDASHAQSILRNKIITDFVQLGNTLSVVSGASTLNLTLALDVDTVTIPGVTLNKAVNFRTSLGDPFNDSNGKEVVAKITSKVGPHAGGGFDYVMSFFENDGTTPFTFPANATLDILYPVKSNLWDATENFAANERFVDGAVDIRTKLNIEQLAKDIYGDAYVFNANGDSTQTKTLYTILSERTLGGNANTAALTATQIIDEVYEARGGKTSLLERLNSMAQAVIDADKAIRDDLASAVTGKGASTVGIEDSGSLFTGNTVEAVTQEIGTEIKNARGSKASIDERLDVSINEDGTLKDSAKIHVHGKLAFKLDADGTDVIFDSLASPKITGAMIKDGTDDLEVYINGSLQAETFNYTTHVSGGFITGFSFAPDVITTADVVMLKWTKYSA